MTIDIEELRKDMEAGTQGPWLSGHFADDTHQCDCRYIIAEYGGMGSIATIDVCEKMDGPWGDDVGPALPQAQANSRRIARLPELEREYLALREAADALAGAVEKMTSRPASPATGGRLILEVDVLYTVVQAAAYRKATQ